MQHDQAHVVVHPDARDAVGAVHERRAEGRHVGRRKVRAHGLEVGPEPRAEEVEGRPDLAPLPQRVGRGGVEVRVLDRVARGGGGFPRRGEASRHRDAARGGHQARERGRGLAPAHSRAVAGAGTAAWAWAWAWGLLCFPCLAFSGEVPRCEAGEPSEEQDAVVKCAVTGRVSGELCCASQGCRLREVTHIESIFPNAPRGAHCVHCRYSILAPVSTKLIED